MGSFEWSRGMIVMMAVMTACSTPLPPAPSSAVTTGSAAALIDLQPFTISFRGQTIARLSADGRTESAGINAPGTVLVPGPVLHADGTMVMTRGGVTARIDGNGDIWVAEPAGAAPREQLFGRISGDQMRFAGSRRPWSVRVQGNLIEFSENNSSVIDGDVTPSMRHTALIMAAAFYIEGGLTPP